jgi:transposase/predicted Rdx family selenoprotein
MVIRGEVEAEILRLHHVEKWPTGTIAAHLQVHHDVVTRVITTGGAPPARPQRSARIDAYVPFILESLRRYPGLLSSRLYQMCRERGYRGSGEHFRHMVARHRPPRRVEAFLRTTALPGEHGQVDWAHFGKIKIGRAERPLLAFVCVLSYSRRIFLRFYLDQRIENFLRGHTAAFAAFGGLPRVLIYDNLKSAVLDRRGDAILFNPRLVAFAKHYRFEIRPAAVARGNEKGRVERAIGYARTSFWPARRWRDLDDLNAQAEAWCVGEASERPWPDDKQKTVAVAFVEEQPRLLVLPDNAYETEEVTAVKVGKTPHVRFEGNDYSVPHTLVRRTVEVRATLERVRVLTDGAVVAEHVRSFDRGLVIEDPAHIAELRKSKGEARKHRALDRLAQSAPSSQQIFVRLAEAGANLGRATQHFVELLDAFGPVALEQAIREALERDRIQAPDVRLILERHRRESGGAPRTRVDLPDDARVRNLVVPVRDLGSYDQLLDRDQEVDDVATN